MSRNFELLNRISKEQVLLQAEAVAPTTDASPEARSSPTFVAPLEIDRTSREEVTKLVHRLFLLSGEHGPRRVVFTSTESGNGNTWMCAHVAEILASQVSGSACVVDCNFQSPSLHQQFGLENHFGLADALQGERPVREYARQLRPNLSLLSCGASSGEARELLTSDRMRRRLSELSAEFDYVLMDVAPLNACNHSVVLGSLADGVVLVLKAHSSRRDSTRDAIQGLQASNVRVLGVVLNQRTFPIPERIYSRL